jgi:hypothetical protein
MHQWARTMTARGGAAIPGVLVAKPGVQTSVVAVVANAAEVVAESPPERVARFRSVVSRNAYDLAVFLSVPHPLTVPVMRLVQRSMLPSTSTAELAEFFVGGLLQRLEDASAPDGGQPNEAGYQFVEGVREELIRSLRYSEEGEINAQLRLVGRYLLEEGSEASSFEAYFPSPTGRYRLAEWTLPFASLSQQVLRGSLLRTEERADEEGADAVESTPVPRLPDLTLPSAEASFSEAAHRANRGTAGTAGPKTIIVGLDGTWGGPKDMEYDGGTASRTNVSKLFSNFAGVDSPGTLPLAQEQERTLADNNGGVLQIAKYLNGGGDSDNFLVRVLGGTLGAGLISQLVRGYTFISRNYVAGDQIFIIGFSRGAYTARALAGMITNHGLLDAIKIRLDDKTNAYQLGSAVWYAHFQTVRKTNPDLLGRLQEFALDLPGFFAKPPPGNQLIQAPIEAVAVWETVGPLGIPYFVGNETRMDVFQFADTKLSTAVRRGINAVAVDEQRDDFTPTFWDADPRIMQVLFPGAHADVGGGNPASGEESALSDCALVWMIAQLTDLGARFAATPMGIPLPDPHGIAHQPWNHAPWNMFPRRPRVFPSGLCLSQCLLDRLRGGPVVGEPGTPPSRYAPGNLGDYLVGTDPVIGVTLA